MNLVFFLVFFRLFDGALETSNFRFEEARSAITLFLFFLLENTQRGKIARVKFAEELDTVSKKLIKMDYPSWRAYMEDSLSHLDDIHWYPAVHL